MIVKTRDGKSANNKRQKSGEKVEKDVSFYLSREFADREDIFVFNDLRVEHNEQFAQIDHLILYKKGFILIESKSIKGKVRVNKQLEWQRTFNGHWQGMASPIAQAHLQKKLLKQLLNENADIMLNKLALIGIQAYFGGRCWDLVCASSNETLIERDSMPKSISNQIVKAEQIANKVSSLISSSSTMFNTNPNFSPEEMMKVRNFLLGQHKPLGSAQNQTSPSCPEESLSQNLETKSDLQPQKISSNKQNSWFKCRACGSYHTTEKSGRFGYYVQCENCQTNTSMKQVCLSCGGKAVGVSKNKSVYTLTCECGYKTQYTSPKASPLTNQ